MILLSDALTIFILTSVMLISIIIKSEKIFFAKIKESIV